MGISTDAILMYGVVLEDDTIEGWDEVGDHPPKDSPMYMVWSGDTTPDGIVIQHHCSGDYPQYIVGIKATKTTAYRGYPQLITSLDSAPEWAAIIDTFMDKHSLKRDMSVNYGKPGWLLFSWWS